MPLDIDKDLLTIEGIDDALISNLVITTHPGLSIKNRYRHSISPSPIYTQQSTTITIPHLHYCLVVEPTIASLPPHRHSKLIVTLNHNICEVNRSLTPESGPNARPYEVRVSPGINRIEVEVWSGPARGAAKVGVGRDVEYERITVLLHVIAI